MLLPNKRQQTKLFLYANTARYAYNWAIAQQQENYKLGGKFISDNDLRKTFTQLKSQPDYTWLKSISNNVTKQAIKDACNTYIKFFRGQCKLPKFKAKKLTKPSFYQDVGKIQFTSTHVKFEGFASSQKANKKKFNWCKLAEKDRIPTNAKYMNPRITFDGLNWWISVGVDCENSTDTPTNEGIGIDLGIKTLAVCSDIETPYPNINKTPVVKKLKKSYKRLQRKVSRKYLKNKVGTKYVKTKNIKKSEVKLLKIGARLKNIRRNNLHQVTTEIVNRKPMFIVLEDLNVSGMMKNRHLAKAIQEQCLFEFYSQIQYKCAIHNIQFILANRFFPSSKLCSACGHIHKHLKLSDRIFVCPECGNKIDRDYQASLNLKLYGLGYIINQNTVR